MKSRIIRIRRNSLFQVIIKTEHKNASGNSTFHEANIALPHKAGYLDMRKVADEEKAELLQTLAKDGRLQGWQY